MLPFRKADELTVHLKRQLPEDKLNTLAAQTGFMKRKPRKITPAGYLSAFFITVFTAAHSLSALAEALGLLSNTCVSKQAVHKRTNPALVLLLENILATMLTDQLRPLVAACSFLSTLFRRVFICDSTTIKLNKKLADIFPGSRNQTGKKMAQMKIQAVYEMLSERFHHFDISGFTRNDQMAAPDILTIVAKGDLVLRDLGYFALSVLKKLADMGVYFCSRLNSHVSIFAADGLTPFDLCDRLKKHNFVDENVVLGVKEKVRVRLVAVPVPEKVAAKRRREAKMNRDRRLNPSKRHLFLMGWNIFVLNISQDMLNTQQVAKLYRLRWRIEIIFKLWKSHFHLADVPNACVTRVKSYILGMLIVLSSFHSFFAALQIENYDENDSQQLSLFKVSQFCTNHFWAFPLFQDCLERISAQILYHCRYESRQKRTNHAQMVMALG